MSDIHGTYHADFHKPVHEDASHVGLHLILNAADVTDQGPPSPLQGSLQHWSGRAAVGDVIAMHNFPWPLTDSTCGDACLMHKHPVGFSRVGCSAYKLLAISAALRAIIAIVDRGSQLKPRCIHHQS